MKLKYLAHSAFLLTTAKGIRIITDPYEPGSYGGAVGYKPIDEEADIITVSHSHEDHSHISDKHKKAKAIKTPGDHTIGEVVIHGVEASHDEHGGKDRGQNIMFCIRADGLTICHCGDLGHLPDAALAKAIGPVDVLLIPVGGFYTIDAEAADQVIAALRPKVAVPMHYKTEKLGFGIATVEPFLRGMGNLINIGQSEVDIVPGKLAKGPVVWVLRPSKL